MKISATLLDTFDANAPFGCERKWHFKYVQGLPDPGSPNMQLGTNFHSAVEHFLLKGVAPDNMNAEVARLFAAAKPEVIRVRDEGFIELERKMDFEVAPGVTATGRIDVVRQFGPLDWKTTSNLKYAPTPFKLARYNQMVLYSLWQDQVLNKMPTEVTHVYVQTKGAPLVQRIDAKMNSALLTDGRARIISLVERMKQLEKLPVDESAADRTKCFRCPFKDICPPEKATIMSAVDRLQSRLNALKSPAPAAAPAPALTKEAVQAVVPADAPTPVKTPAPAATTVVTSTPIKKALTIQEAAPEPTPLAPAAFAGERDSDRAAEAALDAMAAAKNAPAEPVKRGRGRPPGSKNKTEGAEVAPAMAPVLTSPDYRFSSCTVRMVGKLNMGHYQSLDIEVAQTMEYQGDPNEAFMRVTAMVRDQLNAALESVAGRTVQAPVPAEVISSTKR